MTREELNAYMAKLYGISDKAIESMNGQVEKNMIKSYKASLKNVQSELAGMYEKYGDNVTLAIMRKRGRLEKMEKIIFNEIKA